MPSELAQLREERQTLLDQATTITSKRNYSQAEFDLVEKNLARIDVIDREITGLGGERKRAMAAHTKRGTAWEVNGQSVDLLQTPEQVRAHYAERGDSSPADGSLSDFLRGVAGMQIGGASIRAALSVGTDADGGYLVPHMVMPQILEALAPASACMQAGAGMLPLDSGAKTFTIAAIDSIPTAAWRLENGNVSESAPAFRAAVVAPKSLSFYFKVSRELLQDGAGLQQAAVTAISQAFAKELDRAALRGTGTAPEPRGLLNASASGVNQVTNGANGASLATTKYANFMSAVQAIMEDDAPMPTAAIMSPRSRVTLGSAVDSAGQPLQVPPMLAQLQQLASSQVPNNLTVGTSTDCSEIYLGDFTRMVFAMREQVSIARLGEAFATTGQVGFVCHVRADMLFLYPKAFAVVTGVRA